MQRVYLSQEELDQRFQLRSTRPIFDLESSGSFPESKILHPATVYDQGQIGSCTANAFCNCFQMCHQKKTLSPSRYRKKLPINS